MLGHAIAPAGIVCPPIPTAWRTWRSTSATPARVRGVSAYLSRVGEDLSGLREIDSSGSGVGPDRDDVLARTSARALMRHHRAAPQKTPAPHPPPPPATPTPARH